MFATVDGRYSTSFTLLVNFIFILGVTLLQCSCVNAQTWAGTGATAGQPPIVPGRPGGDYGYGFAGVDSRGQAYGGAGGNGGYYVGSRHDDPGRVYGSGAPGGSPYYPGGPGGYGGGGGGGYGGAGGYGGGGYGGAGGYGGGGYGGYRGYYSAAPSTMPIVLWKSCSLAMLLIALNKMF